MKDYQDFIRTKQYKNVEAGFVPASINPNAKDHQKAIIEWACKRGKAAIFADTGLGKTFMQLEWASLVSQKTGKPVLLLAPLAVGKQTEKEAVKFDITSSAKYVRDPDHVHRIQITNYEMLDRFNPKDYAGIVLDESSILKGQSGAYRKMLTDFATNIPYRLSCTATPSPNDYMELGTQSEFLGVMSQVEMLAMFFTHDGSETQKWRLKGHAVARFWEWMATWSVVISSPSDLGFDGSEYDLPPLSIDEVILPSSSKESLFADIAQGLSAARSAKKSSVAERVAACADWVNSLCEPCLVWAESNEESKLLSESIINSVEVAGSHKQEVKEDRLLGFASGKYTILISKASIAGFGMNYQHASKMAFVGATYSFEQFYQAVRREWRFGQNKPVTVKVFMTEEETGIHAVMLNKMENDKQMRLEMVKVMSDGMKKEIVGSSAQKTDYEPSNKASMPVFI